MTTQEREIEAFTKKKVIIPEPLRIIAKHDERKNDECLFSFLSAKDGDKRIVWNRFSIPEINAAKSLFQECIREGLVPHRVGAGGKSSADVMREFDPSAEEVIFLPIKAIAGG